MGGVGGDGVLERYLLLLLMRKRVCAVEQCKVKQFCDTMLSSRRCIRKLEVYRRLESTH